MARNEQEIISEGHANNFRMQIYKTRSLGGIVIAGSITVRTMCTLLLSIGLGFVLLQTPIFQNNWFAIISYIAFCSILLGHTPTRRNILTNIYGIVFKKPVRMLVTKFMTTTTAGHGIKEVYLDMHDIDAIPFQLTGNKMYALVYCVTSGINKWSSEVEKEIQSEANKNLMDLLEGGERLLIVHKQDNDTSMLKLRDDLLDLEKWSEEDDDLAMLSKQRATLLTNAGTSEIGRSIQQYAILVVKRKNIERMVQELRKMSRIVRPATHPMDVLLSVMGQECGVEWCKEPQEENRKRGESA